jgi:hypothetical protein
MRVMRGVVRILLAAATVSVVATLSIHALKPRKVTPFPPDWPHRAPWKLSRELLIPDTGRILFVVDIPAGLKPKEEALNYLVEVASRYGERPASWVYLGAEDAPEVRWILTESPDEPMEITVRMREGQSLEERPVSGDTVDEARLANEIIDCVPGSLAADVSFVFVRYAGEGLACYGFHREASSTARCGERSFPLLIINQDQIAQHRLPVMFTRESLEKRTLVH